MPALAAARSNPALKKFYQGLIARNKPAKVVLTAVMRKLLVHMNSELKKLAAKPLAPKAEKTKNPLPNEHGCWALRQNLVEVFRGRSFDPHLKSHRQLSSNFKL